MNEYVKLGWLVLAWYVVVVLFLGTGPEASLLEAVIYQLTDGTPTAVGRLFE
jgi:hypothetical protein